MFFKKRSFEFLMLVVLVVLVSGLAIAQEEKIQLSVWGMPWEDAIYTQYAIPQFEEQYPNIKVEFLRFENYWDILLTRHAGGNAPDVQRNLDENYGSMRLRGALLPLTEYVEGPDGMSLDDFHPVALDAITKDGEIWALPQDLSPRNGLYYNMKMFDEAGIPYPTADWTVEQMADVAQKLTMGERPRVERYGISWADRQGLLWFIYAFGGDIWAEDGKKCVIDSEECLKGVNFALDLIYEYGAAPSYVEVTPEAMEDLFKAEKVAMFIGGGWNIPAITRDVPDLEFGVAPMPLVNGERTTILGQCIFEMSSQTKHPDAAWKLIKHLVSPQALTDYWQRTWVAAPSRLSLIKDPEIFENIIGIPGHVPAITDPEEFERKLGWMRDIILNGEFTTAHVGDFYTELYEVHLRDALELLAGPRRGDVKAILEEVAAKTNKDIEGFYKGQ